MRATPREPSRSGALESVSALLRSLSPAARRTFALRRVCEHAIKLHLDHDAVFRIPHVGVYSAGAAPDVITACLSPRGRQCLRSTSRRYRSSSGDMGALSSPRRRHGKVAAPAHPVPAGQRGGDPVRCAQATLARLIAQATASSAVGTLPPGPGPFPQVWSAAAAAPDAALRAAAMSHCSTRPGMISEPDCAGTLTWIDADGSSESFHASAAVAWLRTAFSPLAAVSRPRAGMPVGRDR